MVSSDSRAVMRGGIERKEAVFLNVSVKQDEESVILNVLCLIKPE